MLKDEVQEKQAINIPQWVDSSESDNRSVTMPGIARREMPVFLSFVDGGSGVVVGQQRATGFKSISAIRESRIYSTSSIPHALRNSHTERPKRPLHQFVNGLGQVNTQSCAKEARRASRQPLIFHFSHTMDTKKKVTATHHSTSHFGYSVHRSVAGTKKKVCCVTLCAAFFAQPSLHLNLIVHQAVGLQLHFKLQRTRAAAKSRRVLHAHRLRSLESGRQSPTSL